MITALLRFPATSSYALNAQQWGYKTCFFQPLRKSSHKFVYAQWMANSWDIYCNSYGQGQRDGPFFSNNTIKYCFIILVFRIAPLQRTLQLSLETKFHMRISPNFLFALINPHVGRIPLRLDPFLRVFGNAYGNRIVPLRYWSSVFLCSFLYP